MIRLWVGISLRELERNGAFENQSWEAHQHLQKKTNFTFPHFFILWCPNTPRSIIPSPEPYQGGLGLSEVPVENCLIFHPKCELWSSFFHAPLQKCLILTSHIPQMVMQLPSFPKNIISIRDSLQIEEKNGSFQQRLEISKLGNFIIIKNINFEF